MFPSHVAFTKGHIIAEYPGLFEGILQTISCFELLVVIIIKRVQGIPADTCLLIPPCALVEPADTC